MRQLLLGGTALLALATSAHAQTTPPSDASRVDAPLTDSHAKTTDVTGRSGRPSAASSPAPAKSGLDTLVTDDAAPPPPPPTGNPVLDRLNALEAKVQALETRNHELEAQAIETQTRVQKVEVRAAKGVQPGVSPTFADVNDNFTFKARGMLQVDYAHYNERAGGYNYNDGTDLRRARFGFDGTAFKLFKYRIEAEFIHNTVNLLDAYLQYQPTSHLVFTVGQHKAPYGLEANSSDAFNEFLERGMANVAFGAVGAERRIGASLGYQSDKLNAQVGVFGAGEGVQRNATTPDETVGVNGRITFDPILDQGRLLHVGASAYHVDRFAAKTITAIGDRPGTRVDGGLIESLTIGPVPTGPIAGQTRGVSSATFLGGDLYTLDYAGPGSGRLRPLRGPGRIRPPSYRPLWIGARPQFPGRLRLRQLLHHRREPRLQEWRDRSIEAVQRFQPLCPSLGRVGACRPLRLPKPHGSRFFAAEAQCRDDHRRAELVSEPQYEDPVQLYPLHRPQLDAGGGACRAQRHDGEGRCFRNPPPRRFLIASVRAPTPLMREPT